MACSFTVRFANPPTGSCVSQDLVDTLNEIVEVTDACEDSGVGVTVGFSPPGVDEIDQIWLRTTAQRCPRGFYSSYMSQWRRVPSVPIGTEGFYSGPTDGIFTSAGVGIVGEDWDGWELVFDDANKLIVIAESYDGTNWVSSVDGSPLATGGAATKTLATAEVPSPIRPAVTVGHANADAATNVGVWGGVLYSTVGTMGSTELLAADPGNAAPTAFSLVPPYVAKALVRYVGYCPP